MEKPAVIATATVITSHDIPQAASRRPSRALALTEPVQSMSAIALFDVLVNPVFDGLPATASRRL
jgi:hypothetical protein